MGGRDLLDALGIIKAASHGIHQALSAAQDHRGELDPMLIDVDLVEQHRSDYGFGLDFFEQQSGRRREHEEVYARLRRARFSQLPGRIRTADMVEMVEPNPIREAHEPAEPRREWA
jgi:hypothetical protein